MNAPLSRSALQGALPLAPPQEARLTASALRFAPETAPTFPVIEDVLALRQQHWARGHTPAQDAGHGALFFINAAQEFLRNAAAARTAPTRRRWQIAAIAMLVALVDQEDFVNRTGEPADV